MSLVAMLLLHQAAAIDFERLSCCGQAASPASSRRLPLLQRSRLEINVSTLTGVPCE